MRQRALSITFSAMQMKVLTSAFLGLLAVGSGDQLQGNPLGKVLELLGDLSARITEDGEKGAKAYREYVGWCDSTSSNVAFTEKNGQAQKEELAAKIDELSGDIEVAKSKIEKLADDIASAQAELKEATVVRKKEHEDFAASEKELAETVDALGRAMDILEKEMHSGASLSQVSANSASVLQGLNAVLQAASFPVEDRQKLTALVQAHHASEDEELEPGAPAAAVYQSHGSGIVDVIQDMKEKAEGQLSDLRKGELESRHNFEMVEGSLKQKIEADSSDLEEHKGGRAKAQESKASAEGDLKVTTKELAECTERLADVRAACMRTASDYAASVAARKEELEVISKAIETLKSEATSFLQVSAQTESAGSRVVSAVKRLARQQHSAALAQLASRVAVAFRSGDSFAKVKGLIQDMISKLERQAQDEATEKSYCDEQMAKTGAKKEELQAAVQKLTSTFDQATARSAKLKEEVRDLEMELAALAKEQAEMDKIRQESKADYLESKADQEKGLSAVRKALGILRDYYGSKASMIQDDDKFNAFMQQPSPPEKHSKSSGAGGSIIDILEICESDLATSLAKEEAEETDSQSEYDEVSQKNAVSKTMSEQGVKYKTQELKSLQKTMNEVSADQKSTDSELSAVLEYEAQLKDRCIAQPEKYEDRVARREAEINGLKEAMSILEDETALFQRKRRSFRGSLAAE